MELSDYEVLLLIDLESDDVFPFSSHGFDVASGSLKSIRKRAAGCIFLDARGSTFRISNIEAREKGLFATLKCSFGGPFPIRTSRETVDVALGDLRKHIRTGVFNYKERFYEPDEAWELIGLPEEQISKLVDGADSSIKLYRMLGLPKPEDCLDLL